MLFSFDMYVSYLPLILMPETFLISFLMTLFWSDIYLSNLLDDEFIENLLALEMPSPPITNWLSNTLDSKFIFDRSPAKSWCTGPSCTGRSDFPLELILMLLIYSTLEKNFLSNLPHTKASQLRL